jgi:photosystem II stability/assembly factor-like uncharacterized protein
MAMCIKLYWHDVKLWFSRQGQALKTKNQGRNRMQKRVWWICSGIFLLLFLLSAPVMASTTWQQTGGPEGGYISALAMDTNNSQIIYAGTISGVMFKTTDGGGSWSAANSGLTATDISALAIDPTNSQTIYAGTIGSGSFKSTNGGGSWNRLSGLTATKVICLVIDPTNNQIIYAGTNGNAVYKSTDGGGSWNSINSGITSMIVMSLAIDQSNSQTLYAGTGAGVFKTIDGGGSWSSANSELTSIRIKSLVIDPTHSQIIYAASNTIPGEVFKSTDGGGTWSAVLSGQQIQPVMSLAIDPTNNQTIYASVQTGISKSTDGGTSWNTLNNGLPFLGVISLVIDPTNSQTIYTGTTSGVFKSTDGGSSWNSINNKMVNTNVLSLAIDLTYTPTIFAGTNGSGIFNSTDGGSSWSTLNSGLQTLNHFQTIAIDPVYSQTIYAGSLLGLFKSNDGGNSWNYLLDDGASIMGVYSLAIEPLYSQIYVGTDSGVMKSADGGSSWSPLNNGMPSSTWVRSLAIVPTNNQMIYAGSYYSGVFKSTNGGRSWTLLNNKLTNTIVTSLVIDLNYNQTIYAGTFDLAEMGVGGVYKSTDGGITWNAVNSGLTSTKITSLAIGPPQTIYAGTSDSGVFISTNGGGSWNTVNNGLNSMQINSLAYDISSGNIYAGTTDCGVYKGITIFDDPTISGTPATTAIAGTFYGFTPAATEATNFYINNKPPWANFNTTTGALTGLPTSANVGTYDDIVIWAANGMGTAILPPFAISVIPVHHAPMITSFTIPTNSSSLTVPITLIASDSIGPISYLVSESATRPGVAATGWSTTAPTDYTFIKAGAKTLYAWAKDSTNEISLRKSGRVNIVLPPTSLTINKVPPTNQTTVIISGTKEAGSTITANPLAGIIFGISKTSTVASTAWNFAASGKFVTGDNTISFNARDNAGNTVTQSVIVTYDTTPPTGTIHIKGTEETDSFTNKRKVTLQLTCDGTGSAPAFMQFSNNNKSWSAWRDYNVTATWALSTGDGIKMVYARFKDAAGNISSVQTSNAIILDQTPPRSTITINSGALSTTSHLVTLTLNATDDCGVTQMQFSNDEKTWSAPENYSTTKTWPLSGADGKKTVYARFTDTAGNSSAVISASIVLKPIPIPPGPIVLNDSSFASTNQTYKIISGIKEPGTKIEVTATAPVTAGATIETQAGNTWSCMIRKLASGDNIVTVKKTDSQGHLVAILPLDVLRTN